MLLNYKDSTVAVRIDKYIGGGIKLDIFDVETYTPLMVLTTNIGKLGKNLIAIKDSKENQGCLTWMQRNGLVTEVVGYDERGYGKIPVARVDVKRLVKVCSDAKRYLDVLERGC